MPRPINVPYLTVLQIIRNKCELQTFPLGVTRHCDTVPPVLGLSPDILESWRRWTGDWREARVKSQVDGVLVTGYSGAASAKLVIG